MKKHNITLEESKLRSIIRGTVNESLSELSNDTMMRAAIAASSPKSCRDVDNVEEKIHYIIEKLNKKYESLNGVIKFVDRVPLKNTYMVIMGPDSKFENYLGSHCMLYHEIVQVEGPFPEQLGSKELGVKELIYMLKLKRGQIDLVLQAVEDWERLKFNFHQAIEADGLDNWDCLSGSNPKIINANPD